MKSSLLANKTLRDEKKVWLAFASKINYMVGSQPRLCRLLLSIVWLVYGFQMKQC